MNTDNVRKLLQLDDERKDLEARIKEISEKRKGIESQVLDAFAEAGVDKVRVDGRTVSLRRELWASPLDGDKDRACEYLETSGLGVYVNKTFNTLSISAWVRERDRDGDLPDDFKDYFKVSETFKVDTRK